MDERSPLGFSATDLVGQFNRLGRIEVAFPPPDTSVSPDSSGSDTVTVTVSATLARPPRVAFVEGSLGRCALATYLRVSLDVHLSDLGGRFEASGTLVVSAGGLEPSTWYFDGHRALSGTVAPEEVRRITALLTEQHPLRAPFRFDHAIVRWGGIGETTVSVGSRFVASDGGAIDVRGATGIVTFPPQP